MIFMSESWDKTIYVLREDAWHVEGIVAAAVRPQFYGRVFGIRTMGPSPRRRMWRRGRKRTCGLRCGSKKAMTTRSAGGHDAIGVMKM